MIILFGAQHMFTKETIFVGWFPVMDICFVHWTDKDLPKQHRLIAAFKVEVF